jgi:hypothetical protein
MLLVLVLTERGLDLILSPPAPVVEATLYPE